MARGIVFLFSNLNFAFFFLHPIRVCFDRNTVIIYIPFAFVEVIFQFDFKRILGAKRNQIWLCKIDIKTQPSCDGDKDQCFLPAEEEHEPLCAEKNAVFKI